MMQIDLTKSRQPDFHHLAFKRKWRIKKYYAKFYCRSGSSVKKLYLPCSTKETII